MFFDPNLLRSAALALSLVIQAMVFTLLGFLLGQWIDGHFQTAPYLQIFCTFLSFSLGMHNLIVRIKLKKNKT
jgi:F0F1-type ATP synthase assembly protein I